MTQFDPVGPVNELHGGVVQELSAQIIQLEGRHRKLRSHPGGVETDPDRITAHGRQSLKSLCERMARLRDMEWS